MNPLPPPGPPAPALGRRVVVLQLGEALGRVRGAPPPGPVPPPRKPCRRPARVAQLLSLAHQWEHDIEHGLVPGQADLARRQGLTRARVTQVLSLLQLAPDLQERLLHLEAVDGIEPLIERDLHPVAACLSWVEQRIRFQRLEMFTGRRRPGAL